MAPDLPYTDFHGRRPTLINKNSSLVSRNTTSSILAAGAGEGGWGEVGVGVKAIFPTIY